MIILGHFIGTKSRWIHFEFPAYRGRKLNCLNDSDFISLSFKQFDVKKDQYFKNILQSYTYFNLKNYAKLGKPVDKER